jgi:hypothetical protein
VYNFGSGSYPIKVDNPNNSTLPSIANIVGNAIKRGENSTTVSRDVVLIGDTLAGGSRVYVAGNYFYEKSGALLGQDRVTDSRGFRSSESVFASGELVGETIDAVISRVLSDSGAKMPRRDVVDVRVVNSVANGTGTIVDCVVTCNESSDRRNAENGFPPYTMGTASADADHDGMPDEWELTKGLDPQSGVDRNLLAPSGYTWVEEYINSLI